LTGAPGIRRIDAQGPAGRRDLSRTLIRIWIDNYEAGTFDEDSAAAHMIGEEALKA